MSYTVTEKNAMLDNFKTRATHAALATAFPGAGPAITNEVSGGTYARTAITWGAAGSGQVAATAVPAINVPSGVSPAWLVLMDALSGGNMRARMPLGGSPKEIHAVDTTADTITVRAHGYTAGQTIVFYGGTPPGGLVEGTVYYVRDVTTDTFKVAATSGGVAIDLTAQADTLVVVSAITINTFASAGTLTVSSLIMDLLLA